MAERSYRFERGDVVEFDHDGETATGMVQMRVEQDGTPAYAVTRDETNERVFVLDGDCESVRSEQTD